MSQLTTSQPQVSVSIPVASGCPACESPSQSTLLGAPDRFHGRSVQYRLMSCSACSLVWLADPPPPEQMGEHYGQDYDQSVARAGDFPERWSGRVAVIAQSKKGGTLLDLGCSSGGFLGAMRSPAWTLHGIEMSQEVARRAEAASGATVFVGDIPDAPYAPNSFDVITCFHVLEHVYEPLVVLQRIESWLKPGGIFYFMVPNIDSAGARIFGSYWYALELPRHLYHYSPRSLGVMADAVGLRTLSMTTHRELFFEDSVGYLFDDFCRRAHIRRLPRARRGSPTFAFRAARKAFRLTFMPLVNRAAGCMGGGESIHGILQKPGQ